ncbi:recombinase family protein [Vibrio vulnificus]|nr:recombinase family protein [Vibrio vulnificus]
METKSKRFAVTYQRFSSERQMNNSSLDRQTDAQKAWLKQNPDVTVIDSFVDEAMSGWSGKHLEDGSLGQLMTAVEDGIIPKGTLILVEHFSRLTRQNIDNAEELIKRLWKSDITVVTVRDNTEYPPSAVNNMALRIRLIVEMEQAFKESEWRSEKVKASYTRREKQAREGVVPKMRKPFWLNPDGTLNHLHEAVKDMFNWYRDGLGQQRLVVRLREKYPDSAIQKINPSTVMRWIQADIVRGYWRGNRIYDAAIDDQLFYEVQKIHKSRLYKNVNPDRKWPLSGLMQCGVCGGGMSIQKTKNSNPVVRCSSKQRDKSCNRKTTFPYFIVHMYMMTCVLDHALKKYTNRTSNKELQLELTKTESELLKARTKLANEKEFYNKVSQEGKSTLMILDLMNDTHSQVSELEEKLSQVNQSLASQDQFPVTPEANNLIFQPEHFNIEMHRLGFKLIVNEESVSTTGFDEKVPTMQYLGYSRKNRSYAYAIGTHVQEFFSEWVTEDLLMMKALEDLLRKNPHVKNLWDNWDGSEPR